VRILLLPLIILYRLHFAAIFFVVLTLLYPVFWFLLLNEKNYNKVWKLKILTSRIILFLDFIYLKREIRAKKLEGPYVICANHASYLDIILMYPILPKTRFLFMGKSELLKWPVINIFFRKLDIAVNREKRHSAMRSIVRAKKEIMNGWSIVIYPEGGIPIDAPKMAQFKNGAFKMAIDLGVPILPITLLDNWKLFGTDPVLSARAHPGVSHVIVHEPIPTKGLEKKDLVSLRSKTFEIINKPLMEKHGDYIEKL
jgi:1-acyl-sn-glycerol-3-phosphate acyltransferase